MYNGSCTGLLPPFPLPRLLYNVYSNGSNKPFPAATPLDAELRQRGGFHLQAEHRDCRRQHGVGYRTEIDAVVKAWGFFPLPDRSTRTPDRFRTRQPACSAAPCTGSTTRSTTTRAPVRRRTKAAPAATLPDTASSRARTADPLPSSVPIMVPRPGLRTGPRRARPVGSSGCAPATPYAGDSSPFLRARSISTSFRIHLSFTLR